MMNLRMMLAGLLIVAAGLMLSACGNEDIASIPEAGLNGLTGIQTGLSPAAVQAAGFSQCYADTYATTGMPLGTILAGCPGNLLLLACRPVGATNLTLAAYAPRAIATADTGADSNGLYTDFNGVGWYYNANWSWGFFVSGDGVAKNSCDTDSGAFPNLRMCWHANGGNIDGGYRCGNNFLNGDPTWQRLIYSS